MDTEQVLMTRAIVRETSNRLRERVDELVGGRDHLLENPDVDIPINLNDLATFTVVTALNVATVANAIERLCSAVLGADADLPDPELPPID